LDFRLPAWLKKAVSISKVMEGSTMYITYHAAERFLQRVFEMTGYSSRHIKNAKKLLRKELADITTHRSRFILPSFPKFIGITVNNKLVTIIPKDDKKSSLS
jgi:O-methyltransferase involved in polyketide biosynthesis